MTSKEAWNEVCTEYTRNQHATESIIQTSWNLLCGYCFNYPREDIIEQQPVKMGVSEKRVDIVIKCDDKILFVIELKKHDLTKEKNEEQLFSYLNQLKVNFGFLVCNNLYLYDYDFTVQGYKYEMAEIPFIKNNPDGIKFIELFSKDNFDQMKIKEFIKTVSKKNAETIIRHSKSLAKREPSVSGKDKTKYKVNGKLIGGKCKIPYTVVEQYVEHHQRTDFNELKRIFSDTKIHKGNPTIIRKIEDVEDETRFDKRKITLTNGDIIAVSNQWAANSNWPYFLEIAKEIDIKIEAVLD